MVIGIVASSSGGIGPENVHKSRRKITLFKTSYSKINQNLIPKADAVFGIKETELIYLPALTAQECPNMRKHIYAK